MEGLKERLSNQLRVKGVQHPEIIAEHLLEKRGQMKNGHLTAEGKKRQSMGRAGRAKDRAAKESGGKSEDYKYNPKTNRATKK